MQSQFSGMVHHPLNSALPMLLVPLITIIVRSLKKSRARPRPAAAAAPNRADHRDGDRLTPANQGAIPRCPRPSETDPERIPAGSVPADPYRAGARTRPSRRRRRSGLYLRRAARCRGRIDARAVARRTARRAASRDSARTKRTSGPSRSPPRRRLGIPLRRRSQSARRSRLSFRRRTFRRRRICLDQRTRQDAYLSRDAVSHL